MQPTGRLVTPALVWRPLHFPAPRLPVPHDPARAAILAGLARAAGASGCTLRLTQPPDGPTVLYRWGVTAKSSRQRLQLRPADNLTGECELHTPTSSARGLRACASLGPMLEGALHTLIERCATSRQVELLIQYAKLRISSRGQLLSRLAVAVGVPR